MNTTFDTRIVLLFCTLLHGLTGLRLNRVSIPAYKLRGESAFLECQYELNRPNYVANSNSKYQHNQHGAGAGGGAGGNDMNYIDTDSAAAEELPVYRRMRTHSELQQSHRNHHQQQQQQQEQHHYFNSGAGGVGGRVGGYHQAQFPTETAGSAFAGRSSDYDDTAATRRRQTYHDSMSVASGGAGGGGGGYGVGTYDALGRRISGSSYGGHFNAGSDDERDASFGVNESDELPDDSEALYAVKWYKDNEEFYRYVPKANPPKQSYRVDGVRVIEEHSDSTRVLLRGLTLNSTGLYRCEVSAEAPNFSSAQGEGRMDIVYLPRDGPHIKGQQFQYQIGEILNLNCTSGKSHPASHLQWFINEQPVMDTRFLVHYNDTVHKHGLITSTLGLQLTVDARHFFNGAMKVKCLASISPVLWKGGKESVLQRRPGIIDNREAMLLVRSRATSLGLLKSSPCLLSLIFLLCTLSQLLLQTALR